MEGLDGREVPSHHRKLTLEQAKDILASLAAGVRAQDLAEKYQIAISSIYDIRRGKSYKEIGGDRVVPIPILSEAEAKVMMSLHKEGKTLKQISSQLNRSVGTVHSVIAGRRFPHLGGSMNRERKRKPTDMRDAAKKLLKQGLTIDEVVEELKCSKTTAFIAQRELRKEQKEA